MEPRQQRPTLTKHAPAWTDCMSTPPPGELHFGSLLRTAKKLSKNQHNYPNLGFSGHNDPESDPLAPQKETKIPKKMPPNRL